MRTLASIFAVFGLAACAVRPATSTDETGTSESSTTTTGETDPSGTGESETDEPVSPCDCAEGELCVADCSGITPGVPVGKNTPDNERCFSEPACPLEQLDTPECRELLCGSPYHTLVEQCDERDPPGFDALCSYFAAYPCDVEINDCPEGEKCVPLPLTDEGLLANRCVGVPAQPDPKPAGEPCTRGDDLFDDCDEQSLCWCGELVPKGESCAGTCVALCSPMCPEGQSCQALDADGVAMLCAP